MRSRIGKAIAAGWHRANSQDEAAVFLATHGNNRAGARDNRNREHRRWGGGNATGWGTALPRRFLSGRSLEGDDGNPLGL